MNRRQQNRLIKVLAAISILILLVIILMPSPQAHCEQQLTLTTEACYLELTK